MAVTLAQECDKAKRIDAGNRHRTTMDAPMTRFFATA
jgi:hypothetical protein